MDRGLSLKGYHAPAELPEALEVLDSYGGKAMIIAGGTDLVIRLREGSAKPAALVDITRIPDLKVLGCSHGSLEIGAAVTHSSIASSRVMESNATALWLASSSVGSPQIRAQGTIGGNLANASPAADGLTALMALDAELIVERPGSSRRLAVDGFHLGPGKAALEPDEIITRVMVKPHGPNESSYFIKFGRRRAVTIAVVNVACWIQINGSRFSGARIALGSVASTVIRARRAEETLVGASISPEVVSRAASVAVGETSPISDIRAPEWYRSHLVGVLTRRCLLSALARLGIRLEETGT